MIAAAQNLDVFLSYVPGDHDVAEIAERALHDHGVNVHTARALSLGQDYAAELRRMITESDALIFVTTPASIRSSIAMVELGAAMSWGLPVHLLLSRIDAGDLPQFLQQYESLAVSELPRLVEAIGSRANLLDAQSEEAQELLRLYEKTALPVDQLAMDPAALITLSEQLRKRTGKTLTRTAILHSLLTLRKRGHLPRLKKR